jgi:23S rRNA (pseudouridine1915-N3)-methyltransferase
MRQLKIVCIGKIKQSAKYLEPGIALYQKRLSRDLNVSWVELPEIAPSPTRPVEQILEKEAESILKHWNPDWVNVLLSERGKLMTSEEFTQWFFATNPPVGGRPKEASTPIMVVVGGAYGTAERFHKMADSVISLSPLTFPHQMVRLLLMEALYRAHTIQRNEPYHK